MEEFLEEADCKGEPHEITDTDELLELIRNIQYYTMRDTEPENEFLERIKSLETSVKEYADLVWDANNTAIPTSGDDETEEEAKEYFIENDVREARDEMKKVLEKTITHLESCVKNEFFVMFSPDT